MKQDFENQPVQNFEKGKALYYSAFGCIDKFPVFQKR
jgi:hypothetical protein